jgi:hypothetical protein
MASSIVDLELLELYVTEVKENNFVYCKTTWKCEQLVELTV